MNKFLCSITKLHRNNVQIKCAKSSKKLLLANQSVLFQYSVGSYATLKLVYNIGSRSRI